jgi:osmotically-inducible protein OsmY
MNSKLSTLSRRLALLSMVAAVSALGACAATRTEEGTGQYVDDTVITTKVKALILNEPMLKSMEINVETFKGRVQLSGFVSNKPAMDKAVELARGVTGVGSVANDMRMK